MMLFDISLYQLYKHTVSHEGPVW